MSSREPQTTPTPGAAALTLVDASSDDDNPTAPGLSIWQRIIRGGAVLGALGTLVGTIFIVSRFAVVEPIAEAIEKSEHSTEKHNGEVLATHKAEGHNGTVSEDLFNEHVSRFEREAERSEKRDEAIIKRLDALGEREYRSERKWRDRLDQPPRQVGPTRP